MTNIKLSIGRIVADRLNEKFKLSFSATLQLQSAVNETIKNALLYDGKIRYRKCTPGITNKRKYNRKMSFIDVDSIDIDAVANTTHTNLDVIELANLRNELREILDDNFKGRILSQETSKKIKRLKYLESKFK